MAKRCCFLVFSYFIAVLLAAFAAATLANQLLGYNFKEEFTRVIVIYMTSIACVLLYALVKRKFQH